MNTENQLNNSRPPIKAILVDIVLNAVIPLLLYRLSKHYISPSELTALLIATTFPVTKNIFSFVRHRALDPISIIVFLAIISSIIALFLGGAPKILLVRESLFTGAFGLACLISLVPFASLRPVMFYFGRFFLSGGDIEKRRIFDSRWERPRFRFTNRLITAVWGSVFTGEFILRIILIYSLPPEAVLVISPIVIGALTIGTIIWTFGYVKRVQRAG
jgi:hypothetical protein